MNPKKAWPFLRTALYLALIVVGILVYAYGWQVTDINLEVPQQEERQEQVVRALRGLLSPDLLERDQESQIAYAQFEIPCDDSPPPQPEGSEEEPYIVLSPACGESRQEITIEGFNFRPYSEGLVRWTPPGGITRPLGSVNTDGQGHFSNQLRVPTVSEADEPHTVEAEISWPVGVPRPSEALKITFDRMIETIFLALMATTFAIFIAIPLSFVAAYNLMRAVEMPLGSLLAAVLPLPVWFLVRGLLQEQQAIQTWLVLGPVSNLALQIGTSVWGGLITLTAIGAVVYFATSRYSLSLARISNPWLRGLVRYSRMLLIVVVSLLAVGIFAGFGLQLSEALSGFLNGLLSNIIGSLANTLSLLMPALGGGAIIFMLGSLLGTLLDPLLDRVSNAVIQRGLGLILGALVGAMLFYLVYTGINSFYNPNRPIPFTLQSTIAGGVLGGGLGLFLGANYAFPIGLVIYYVTRTLLNALRSIEPLIMAIVFAIWVSIGPFAGVLALTLHSIAALGKLYSEQVESIDPGPIEAITATGATRLQTIAYGVVPQIVPPYIAFTLYRWDINVRMSTIIGFVGGGGIGFILQQWINLLQYRQAGVAVLAIAIVVAALDYISAQARERIT